MSGAGLSHPLLLLPAAALLLLAAARYRGRGYYTDRRRRLLLGLRALALLALLPVAGGLLFRPPPAGRDLVVLADESASIAAPKAETRERFIAELRARAAPADTLTVLRFDGTVRRDPSAPPGGEAPAPARGGERTDLAAALAAGAAHATPGRASAIVLLSDGEETAGGALGAGEGLRRAGIPVLSYDLGAAPGESAAISSLGAPQRLYPGEEFDLTVAVSSPNAQEVRVSVRRDDGAPEGATLRLDGKGEQEAVFPQIAPAAGRVRFRARIEGADATAPARERALEVPVAELFPVAFVTESPADSQEAVRLLRRAGFPVEVLDPGDWRRGAGGGGAPPGVIVLDNVPAPSLGSEGELRIERLVREGGAGLLVFGGLQSLGAGEYQGTALERLLPVAMEVPPRGPAQGLSVAIVLDTSLSMFFRERNEDPFYGRGPRKIDIARAAIREVLAALRPEDRIGLLESKNELSWVRRVGPLEDRRGFEEKLDGLFAIGGGINFYSSIREAFAELRGGTGGTRHVMVIADANDIDQREVEQIGRSEDLVREMAAEDVTLSIFAIGNPSDKDIAFLKTMTQLGRGDFYLVSTLATLPRYFRAEYRKKAGEWFLEEPFLPLAGVASGAVLRGLGAGGTPETGGVNIVALRRGAEELLVAPFGTPLLSLWRTGRGRAAVFASDSGARWARRWFSWQGAQRFWTQLLLEVGPRRPPPALEARAVADSAGGSVEVTLRRRDGTAVPAGEGLLRFPGPGGGGEAPLERLGLGRFRAPLPAGTAAGYPFEVAGAVAPEGASGSLEVAPPAESARRGGRALLEELGRGTGGALVKSPEEVMRRTAAGGSAWPSPQIWLLSSALLALFGELLLRY